MPFRYYVASLYTRLPHRNGRAFMLTPMGLGPPDGGRGKCGAGCSEALEEAGRQRLDLHTKRTFTSSQMVIRMVESTTPSIAA